MSLNRMSDHKQKKNNMDIKNALRQLIAENKTKKAIDLLKYIFNDTSELNSIILISARYTELTNSINLGLTYNEYSRIELAKINYALLQLIDKIDLDHQTTKTESTKLYFTSKDSIKVFISYSHKDKKIANKLNNKLKDAGVNIIIDSEMMKAGENITHFIEKSISQSNIILSIVSNNSLLSSWVVVETINTFYNEKFSNKKFIACYTDDDFFNDIFRKNITRIIDKKIKELDNIIVEYMELKIDPSDLNDKKTRLFQLRNNLGDILMRLRNSLCIDVKDEVFEKNVKHIISVINT